MVSKRIVKIISVLFVFVLTGAIGYFALVKKQIADCERKTGSERNQCFRDLAIERKDENLCEKINPEEVKNCIYSIRWDTKLSKIPKTKSGCLAQNGSWGSRGLWNPTERCNPRTSDGKKSCTDYTQCEGSCIAEAVSSTLGMCSEYLFQKGEFDLIDGKAFQGPVE